MAENVKEEMKKLLSLTLILMLSLSLVGCLPLYVLSNVVEFFDDSEYAPLYSNRQVITAGEGELSNEALVEVISAYESSCVPILYMGEGSTVSFKVDFDAVVASVSRLSSVKGGDPEFELDKYIDTAPEVDVEGKKITVHLNHFCGSEIDRYPIWSYLVEVLDSEDNVHCYYFRVDHTAYIVPIA